MSAATEACIRVRARVDGTVQGVGFRPHVFRLATELGLAGFVLNDSRGVLLEIEGDPGAVQAFVERLRAEAPPLARIEAVASDRIGVIGEQGFRILASDSAAGPDVPVSPDMATCADCLAELFDPTDRRHRYPFINCTNCGPRFTIVLGVPYDRPSTTMAGFEMCGRCRAEYEDPLDRRFHAQPNACPDCGPRARLVDAYGGERSPGLEPIDAAAAMLREGAIVSVKGLGGYHLACLADDERAVWTLRSRKHRDQRPFALLVATLDDARRLVELSPAEEALLSGAERPIVIARRQRRAAVAPDVAPGSRDLGVMLPYSPLHHLLARSAGAPLVMTSGNLSDEPIAFEDTDAFQRLAGIADAFLVHDRPIHIRTDDSVVRALDPSVREAPLMLRRSRGYVPGALGLPLEAPRPVLGCGAELKSTFCLARGPRAWVGHHIGDLKNFETLRSFEDGVEHFQRLFAVSPALVAHDLHPDYLATRYAIEREGVELVGVQHHHAHLAATLAEHGVTEPAIGAIFDGAGHGGDGTVWGGEILAGDLRSFERAGLLFPVRLPGGDAAATQPWRMACAWLAAAYETAASPIPPALEGEIDPLAWEGVCRLVETGTNSPLTTSAGRLFDAVAALCGVRATVEHEGQAAAELEGIADPAIAEAYEIGALEDGGDPAVLDPRGAIRAICADLAAGVERSLIAARFHNGLAAALADACAREAERRDLSRVVLAGGVFQNRLLAVRTVGHLRAAGLEPLLPERLPPNDGQISYGQVAVAVARALA